MTPEQIIMMERRWERQAKDELQIRREIIWFDRGLERRAKNEQQLRLEMIRGNKAVLIVALLCLAIPMPTLGEYALSGVLTLAALSVQGLATLWLYPRRF